MKRSGFTLIEMSLTLVIIGLLVGGIFLGKDLIAASQIRGTVGQIDEYKTAYQTFRLKYSCIPGDCVNASQFRLKGIYDNIAYTNGDGDGLIYTYSDSTANTIYNSGNATPKYGESWASLTHMSDAQVIEKLYSNRMPNTTSNLPIKDGFMFFTSLRPTTPPLGYIMPDKAGNFLYISKYPTNSQTFNGASPVLAPAQAYAIDSKIDDGLPMSGSVRPTWANNTCPNIPAANGPCFNIPMKKSVLLPDGNTATIYTVDDTVTPSIYHTNNYTIPNGYTIYATTSISISVD